MKFSTYMSRLPLLLSIGANASTIPQWRRDIPNIGQHVMRGNISAVASWAYAALAYGTIHASNNTSELAKLCSLSTEISTRYLTAFPESSGDVAKLARDAICDTSKATDPSPEPIASKWNNLFWVKSYLAAAFVAQSYYGDLYNSSYAANLCWYVESSLLEGLWIPTPDLGHGLVDVESSFCATAGYYQKDALFQYTNATQTDDMVQEGNELVTKVFAKVLQIVLKSGDDIEYVCTNFGRWEKRISALGVVSSLLKGEICGADRKVVDLVEAKKAFLSAMTDLFSFQLLHAGNAPDYPQWLCKSLKKDGLAKVGLDGTRIVSNACKAAKGLREASASDY